MPNQVRPAIQLPFHFDPSRMLGEIQQLPSQAFSEIPSSYISDRGLYGAPMLVPHLTDPTADFLPSPWLRASPYLTEILATFPSSKILARVHKLQPGARIQRHTDGNRDYINGIFRLHIPVTTGPGAHFLIQDQQLKMQPGETWFINASLPHEVENTDQEERIHLVIDCNRNSWWDAQFQQLGGLPVPESPYARMDLAQLRHMLELLQAMPTPQVATAELQAEIAKRQVPATKD